MMTDRQVAEANLRGDVITRIPLDMLLESLSKPDDPKEKPDHACRTCHQWAWWQRPAAAGGGWVCGVCHPDPRVLAVAHD